MDLVRIKVDNDIMAQLAAEMRATLDAQRSGGRSRACSRSTARKGDRVAGRQDNLWTEAFVGTIVDSVKKLPEVRSR